MTTKPTPNGWNAQPAATAPKVTHGGPAFPVPLHPGQSYQGHAPCDGMTLRDYFAAKANVDDRLYCITNEGMARIGLPDPGRNHDAKFWLERHFKAKAILKYMEANTMLAA